ncbi:MAG: glycoside hydrolase family 3 N-terminal domain-containing protein [Oscillospiraceae bacterium]
MAIAATGRVRDAYDCAGITARQLRGIGVNFNLAPDLDVNSNSMNPVIGVRSFGDDAARVAELGAQAVRGYGEAGLLCCGKHFPGHGDTAVDSHLGLPCIDKSLAELKNGACAVPRRDRGRYSGDNEQPHSVPADRAVGRSGDDEPPHHARYPARRAWF